MTALDDRKASPASMPDRRKRSGCALGHYAEECDCVRPGEAPDPEFGCRDCWGSGDYCGGCGGWGVTRRYGGWIHSYVAGSAATGPSSTHEPIAAGAPAEADDPWASVTGVVDAWSAPETFTPPF